MKTRIALLITSTAVVCTALASCGGSASGPPSALSTPPAATAPPPMTMYLDTAAVLAIVQTKISETSEPFQVDGAAVEVIPVVDETNAPISVDAS
jgi:hypothetical protein